MQQERWDWPTEAAATGHSRVPHPPPSSSGKNHSFRAITHADTRRGWWARGFCPLVSESIEACKQLHRHACTHARPHTHPTAYLLGRLHIALGLQDLLGRRCVSRGREVGGCDWLPWGSHNESRLLRMLGHDWWLEHGRGRIGCFSRTLAAEADLAKGVAEFVGLRPEDRRRKH